MHTIHTPPPHPRKPVLLSLRRIPQGLTTLAAVAAWAACQNMQISTIDAVSPDLQPAIVSLSEPIIARLPGSPDLAHFSFTGSVDIDDPQSVKAGEMVLLAPLLWTRSPEDFAATTPVQFQTFGAWYAWINQGPHELGHLDQIPDKNRAAVLECGVVARLSKESGLIVFANSRGIQPLSFEGAGIPQGTLVLFGSDIA